MDTMGEVSVPVATSCLITLLLILTGYAASSHDSSTSHCPAACKTCSEDNVCASCPQGKYGVSCNQNCSNCNGNICNMTGYCVLGCTSRSYRTEDGRVCHVCSIRCKTCTSSSECGKCNGDYYGLGCEEDCSDCKHSQCNKHGCTTGCNDNFYTKNVDATFTKCLKCPSDYCLKCQSGDRCDKCKPKFWGTFCNKKCPADCPVWCDQDTGVCVICEDRQYIDSTGQCRDCPETCLSCKSDKNCHWCGRGNSGQRCEICRLSSCIECQYDRTSDSATCKTCIPGRYGKYCDSLCSKKCRKGDARVPACHSLNGTCVHGCVSGHYGNFCESLCSKKCRRRDNGIPLCDSLDGTCSLGCVAGRYGEFCESRCSKTCWRGHGHMKICDDLNGTCLHGCVREFTGPFCNQSCGIDCVGGKCNQSEGYCSCDQNYYGLSCNLSCTGKCYDPRNGSSICSVQDGTCLFYSEVYTIPAWSDGKSGDRTAEYTKYVVALALGFIGFPCIVWTLNKWCPRLRDWLYRRQMRPV